MSLGSSWLGAMGHPWKTQAAEAGPDPLPQVATGPPEPQAPPQAALGLLVLTARPSGASWFCLCRKHHGSVSGFRERLPGCSPRCLGNNHG